MPQELLYKTLAQYYDQIYSRKDYRGESRELLRLIKRYKRSPGKDLLELACGTGGHLKYLAPRFKILATDLRLEMLRVARKKSPKVKFKKLDMTRFKLSQRFDVIVCLFGSIGYARTYARLQKTLQNFANHLKPGGVVLIEPWYDRKSFRVGNIHLTSYDSSTLKVARAGYYRVAGGLSILELQYLVARKNTGITYYRDLHKLGLFDMQRTLKIMEDSGLKARYLKRGLASDKGLIVGVSLGNSTLGGLSQVKYP